MAKKVKEEKEGVYKVTYFKTKNGKDWMTLERYKMVISPLNEKVKAPKGFVRVSEWTDTIDIENTNYDFTEDMKSGYLTFQGNVGYFPPSHFIYPEIPKTDES